MSSSANPSSTPTPSSELTLSLARRPCTLTPSSLAPLSVSSRKNRMPFSSYSSEWKSSLPRGPKLTSVLTFPSRSDHIKSGADFQTRIRWKPNTVVLWDSESSSFAVVNAPRLIISPSQTERLATLPLSILLRAVHVATAPGLPPKPSVLSCGLILKRKAVPLCPPLAHRSPTEIVEWSDQLAPSSGRSWAAGAPICKIFVKARAQILALRSIRCLKPHLRSATRE